MRHFLLISFCPRRTSAWNKCGLYTVANAPNPRLVVTKEGVVAYGLKIYLFINLFPFSIKFITGVLALTAIQGATSVTKQSSCCKMYLLLISLFPHKCGHTSKQSYNKTNRLVANSRLLRLHNMPGCASARHTINNVSLVETKRPALPLIMHLHTDFYAAAHYR